MESDNPVEYQPSPIREYQGNPLIEALPRLWNDDEAIELLSEVPSLLTDQEREQPPHIRMHYIKRLLKLFVPFPVHLWLERQFADVVRSGYVDRNPMVPGHGPRIARAVEAYDQARDVASYKELVSAWSGPQTLAQGMTITGVSGMGKSTVVRRILSTYRQVLPHTDYHGQPFLNKQIVWLHLECPGNASLRTLGIDFLQSVDKLLGTNYEARYGGTRLTIDTAVLAMARVAALQNLGVLVIDEIQNISMANSGGHLRFLNHMVQLHNSIGLPIVLVGTPSVEPLLGDLLRQARRSAGRGMIQWDRMKETDPEWDFFIEKLWEHQYTRTPIPRTDPMKHALYDESQGITDLAVKIWALTQARVLFDHDEDPDEVVTEEILRKAARDGFAVCQPILNRIREGKVKEIPGDIYKLDLDNHLSQMAESMQKRSWEVIRRSQSRAQSSPDLVEAAAVWLSEIGITMDRALSYVEQAAKKLGPAADDTSLRQLAASLAFGSDQEASQVPKRNPRRKEGLSPTLMDIAKGGANRGLSPDEALADAGFVCRDFGELCTRGWGRRP